MSGEDTPMTEPDCRRCGHPATDHGVRRCRPKFGCTCSSYEPEAPATPEALDALDLDALIARHHDGRHGLMEGTARDGSPVADMRLLIAEVRRLRALAAVPSAPRPALADKDVRSAAIQLWDHTLEQETFHEFMARVEPVLGSLAAPAAAPPALDEAAAMALRDNGYRAVLAELREDKWGEGVNKMDLPLSNALMSRLTEVGTWPALAAVSGEEPAVEPPCGEADLVRALRQHDLPAHLAASIESTYAAHIAWCTSCADDLPAAVSGEEPTPDPLIVECPKCLSDQGRRCMVFATSGWTVCPTHPERVAAALGALPTPDPKDGQ